MKATSQGNEPFALGFEGEWWDKETGALFVPAPGGEGVVAVIRLGKGLTVVTTDDDQTYDEVLMAAAMVQNVLNKLTKDHGHEDLDTDVPNGL
jgi:hypothetical protein